MRCRQSTRSQITMAYEAQRPTVGAVASTPLCISISERLIPLLFKHSAQLVLVPSVDCLAQGAYPMHAYIGDWRSSPVMEQSFTLRDVFLSDFDLESLKNRQVVASSTLNKNRMLSCSGLLNSASLFNFQFPRVISPGADHHRRVLLWYFIRFSRENSMQKESLLLCFDF